MGYDLFFYTKKENILTKHEITEYLNSSLTSTNESNQQWFVENEDTETYFSIEQNAPETDEEWIERYENFKEFDNTHFSFNLNYLRPDFFGQFACSFVDKFVNDIDLFVLNPQSSTNADEPYKPIIGELYNNWSVLNTEYCSIRFKEGKFDYYPIEKSNDFYQYNLHKKRLQNELGKNYYVPKLYLFKRRADGQIITISTWTEHIPNIFPPADYFLLIKKYKMRVKIIEEIGLISSKTFYDRFDNWLDNFDFTNCKIIHPDKVEQVKDVFNSTQIEHQLADFAERVQIEKLVNVQG